MRMNAWKDKQHDIHLLRMETFSNDDDETEIEKPIFWSKTEAHSKHTRYRRIQEIQKKERNISDYTFIVQIIIWLASKQCHILYIIQLLFSPPQHSLMLDEKRTLLRIRIIITRSFFSTSCVVCVVPFIHSLFSSQLNLVSCRPPTTTPHLTHNMSSTINFFHFTEILFSLSSTHQLLFRVVLLLILQ